MGKLEEKFKKYGLKWIGNNDYEYWYFFNNDCDINKVMEEIKKIFGIDIYKYEVEYIDEKIYVKILDYYDGINLK